ncbi:hypothetical protein RSAG8_13011, partial [Rhizoctonia solani AG-8 WAC10335]
MSTQIHPHWGRPLDLYKDSYQLEAAQQITISAAAEREGLEAIGLVSQLALDVHERNSRHKSNIITLPLLESILKLTLSPNTLRHLDDPFLFSGCIHLMAMVKPLGKPSPFSYEYGYICFRIAAISLGICMLVGNDLLDKALSTIKANPETELLFMLSVSIAQTAQVYIQRGELDGIDPAWDKLRDGPQGANLAIDSDMFLFLETLWKDRILFLQVMKETYSPGLAVLFAVTLKRLRFEELYNNTCSQFRIKVFYEAFQHYLLVATTDQMLPLARIFVGD